MCLTIHKAEKEVIALGKGFLRKHVLTLPFYFFRHSFLSTKHEWKKDEKCNVLRFMNLKM